MTENESAPSEDCEHRPPPELGVLSVLLAIGGPFLAVIFADKFQPKSGSGSWGYGTAYLAMGIYWVLTGLGLGISWRAIRTNESSLWIAKLGQILNGLMFCFLLICILAMLVSRIT